ncbi:MAG: apolipoprotein N-acyltransferase [Planctomycetota bacterium]
MSHNKRQSQKARSSKTAVVPLPSLGRELIEVFLLYTSTLLLLSWIFPPGGIWPLTFVCLIPWAVATCHTRRAWIVHWASLLVGYLFFLVNLRWLFPVTDIGYTALAFYLALYWPLSAWAIRTGRRHGISPLWTLPVVWVACEFLRAWVMSGFPWLFLSHACYAQLPLIQISDLVGAYGVSFLAGLVNGTLVDLILRRWKGGGPTPAQWQLWLGAPVTLVALIGTLGYGYFRCSQNDFTQGPRVAVIQHDFPLESAPPHGERPTVIFAKYVVLAAEAAAERPDVLVFPETVWSATQNIEFLSVEHNVVEGLSTETWPYGKLCHQAISAFARGDYIAVNSTLADMERRYGDKLPRLTDDTGPAVPVVLGATSVETFPEATYPKMERYNSALVYDSDGVQRPKRYDKNHLVPFGEIVPFRYGRLHWLYRWLNKLSPFSYGGQIEYSMTPGRELTVFTLAGAGGTTRFGIPICYEDVMPYVIRRYVWNGPERRVDFLLNISNDGWFVYGNELPQHLAICAYRAVENRVGFARAVNTGISGFIDPNGRIYSVVERDGQRFGPGIIGYRVDHVLMDKRTSFYGRTGDWFAGLCLAVTTALWVVAVIERWVLALRQRIANWRARREKKHGSA